MRQILLGLFLVSCLCSIPLLLPPEKVTVWAWSDAHTNVLASTDLETAVRQVQDLSWDFFVNAGDTFGNDCPSQGDAQEVLRQLGDAREYGYHVLGNHDSDLASATTFETYLSPFSYSAPYDPSGKWDRYSFEVGNLLFLMLSDKNYPRGERPMARGGCRVGGPAGRHTKKQFDWWRDQVESNPQKIIITVSHQALEDTTAYTGMHEGWEEDIHSAFNWLDERGSSFIYAIGDRTTDGLKENPLEGGPPIPVPAPENYRDYLRTHPGAISIWLHGHSHWGLSPDSAFKGRGMATEVSGVLFLNLGALTTKHAPPEVAFSRFLEFKAGSSHVIIKTWLHEDWNENRIGFYDEFTYDLGRQFAPE